MRAKGTGAKGEPMLKSTVVGGEGRRMWGGG